ncbi:MAG: DUF6504 family protein [Bacillota bacterium]|jgi:hypothetical protein
MSKLVQKQITVLTETGANPRSFRWHDRWHHIATVYESWRETGRWWCGEGERVFYRAETVAGGIYELYYDTGRCQWYLYRVYD